VRRKSGALTNSSPGEKTFVAAGSRPQRCGTIQNELPK